MSGVEVVNAKLSTVKFKQPILGTTLAVTALLGVSDVGPAQAYKSPPTSEEDTTLTAEANTTYLLDHRGEVLPVAAAPISLEATAQQLPHHAQVPTSPVEDTIEDASGPSPADTVPQSAPSLPTGVPSPTAPGLDAPTPEVPVPDPTQPPSGVTPPAPTLPTVIPGTETPTVPTTETPTVPTTETPAAPTTETPAAPTTETPTAPSTETPVPETPATETLPTPTSPTGSEPPASEAPASDQPVPVPAPPPAVPSQPPAAADPAATEVLVSEVVVEGIGVNQQPINLNEITVEGTPLDIKVYEAISTRPGRTSTRQQIQADINAIFTTGLFTNVRAEPSDTPLGVRVTYIVQPNPILRSVQLAGNRELAQERVDEIFASQYGSILNLNQLQAGIQQINKLYQDQGFVLGQVVGAPNVDADGTVTLQVAEGQIEAIDVRYLNEDGEPTKGRTRKFIITREMDTQPGEVLNRDRLQADLQRVFGLGLFEDVQVALEPGQDPRKVVVNLNVQERSTGSFSAGAGFSSRSGFFGTGSYTQNNFGGNNQNLNLQIQIGTRELLFDASFTDPWIATDPYGTSYTVNLFNRLTIPLVFDEGPFEDNPECTPDNTNPADGCDVRLPNGDAVRVNRLGAGITFTRPLTKERSKRRTAWAASLGLQYQRVSIRDADLNIEPVDNLGNPLSFSGTGEDDLFSVRFGIGRDLRNDPLNPTKGSAVRLGVEQWIPIGLGSISGTRLRGSYSYFVPVELLRFTKGPQALAFNVQAGTVIGDLPPYEAFTLGGSSSVRGFNEGDLGSGRSFFQATAEYRFPVLKFLGGINSVLFFDYGTNLGTQQDVLGSPGFIRGKPGDGFGYGIGIRVKTPIGPVRLDYGLNNEGDDQFHFGFGQRF